MRETAEVDVAVLGGGIAGLWLGVANELEGFLASVLLPEWRCDVPTVVHALRVAHDRR